jgi:acyl-homoserine-lactone acylase
VYQAAGVVTLDGSRSTCAWNTDPGTPVPGLFDAAHLPQTIRTDYVQNSNDSYWLANPNAPFPPYPAIIGNIDTIQGLRTRQGNQMIGQRIADTDGSAPPKFTLGSLQASWESNQSLLAQLVLPSLVSVCQATPSAKASDGTGVDLAAACKALSGYNGTGNLDATGGWLFQVWSEYAPSQTTTGPTGFWADAFNPADPLSTPSKLNTANPQILTALADAVENLQQHHVPLDASLGQVQHVTRNGTNIPIPGCETCYGAIDAYDGQNSLYKGFSYGQVDYGNSLVMTTELTSQGPVSQGILTYSEATNPKSPWYANMTKLYSQKRWVPLAFTSTQLERQHGLSKTVLTTSTS